ncbi:hypothetical protein PsorP6_015884 [Peronosclerospora sorghi]|uniref:Uncharacterized protein n=1 Tax=Peronosclerospora sorghi TaxID=230839 RepID=A0ACC0WN82_9STRA|nr:hypothetical protein PsorP6_015884 [Peronosclerospora sorghi]
MIELALQFVLQEIFHCGEVAGMYNVGQDEDKLTMSAEDLKSKFPKFARHLKPTGDADCPEHIRLAKDCDGQLRTKQVVAILNGIRRMCTSQATIIVAWNCSSPRLNSMELHLTSSNLYHWRFWLNYNNGLFFFVFFFVSLEEEGGAEKVLKFIDLQV